MPAARAGRHSGRLLAALALAALCSAAALAAGGGEVLHVGLARIHTERLPESLAPEPPPLPAAFRSAEAARTAAPTNQWYSSAMFWRWSRPLYAQPLTFRAAESGFEIGLPEREVAIEDGARKREIRYLHVAALTVVPDGFKPSRDRLARHSDWLAELEMDGGPGQALKATVLHGSPFAYFECTSGDVRVHLAGTPHVLWDPASGGHDRRTLALTMRGHSYALFGPSGSSWDWTRPTDPVLHLPPGARYFSIAGLPDDRDATVQSFLDVAYAFPVTTRSSWRYDEHASRVHVTYHVDTVAREGTNTTTLMGLYPHHWSATATATAGAPHYDSVRGEIRLIRANEFTTTRTYHGFVPRWGRLEDPANRAAVAALLATDSAAAGQLFNRNGRGTYWVGKGLGAVAQLLNIAEAEGDLPRRDALLAVLKSRQQSWFDGSQPTYFHYDPTLGALFGYPQEYHSVTNINDHHFHSGYWLTAAAHIALRDREWAAPEQWGGMVQQLVADIATAERGRADFPFLRNFDSYEGHSWASGTGEFDAGNNEESSSEAINAWAALAMLGEALGDTRLRDLGIYLYTTEVAAVQEYWFDLGRRILAPELASPFASMVFGGKYAYNTWWTEEPRQILGINLLPFTPASTYLGHDPDQLRRSLDALPAEVRAYRARGAGDGTPADVWQDVLAAYLALAEPADALRQWNRDSYVEWGETRTHTLYWIASLLEMGRPDHAVTADTPFYAVFNRGGTRTYLAYNARERALHVTFSDGRKLTVAPHSLARGH